MKIKALVIGLFAAVLAGPALADEPKQSWSGVYLGGHGGIDYSSTAVGLFNPGGLNLDGLAANGVAFGIHGGADLQIPGTKFVVGIGGDYTWSDSEFKVTAGGFPIINAGFNESWAVYGRVGLDMGRVMPYILAGYSEADVGASFGGVSIGSTKIHGWLVGGGLEMALGGNVYLGAEYRLTMFDTLNFGGPGGLDLDTDRHEVRATLKYKFSGMY